MTSSDINKYSKYSIPKLIKIAEKHFNKYIRERDKDKCCISCGNPCHSDAGHYYSGGHYPELRFNEMNVHGQCRSCNSFKHGNLIEYRKGLEKRIGLKEIETLDTIVDFYKKTTYKWDRYFLIETILIYKNKNNE